MKPRKLFGCVLVAATLAVPLATASRAAAQIPVTDVAHIASSSYERIMEYVRAYSEYYSLAMQWYADVEMLFDDDVGMNARIYQTLGGTEEDPDMNPDTMGYAQTLENLAANWEILFGNTDSWGTGVIDESGATGQYPETVYGRQVTGELDRLIERYRIISKTTRGTSYAQNYLSWRLQPFAVRLQQIQQIIRDARMAEEMFGIDMGMETLERRAQEMLDSMDFQVQNHQHHSQMQLSNLETLALQNEIENQRAALETTRGMLATVIVDPEDPGTIDVGSILQPGS
ncbi:MAG: hypothetical protein F9K16_00150 [Thermoanaerobaculia bacterium]|nr:MAG: hypothetical protein F9K16_00150 [Thermoanaerobaculia bacterium]MBZ0103434.1 hypothetical protein [Thermoanaerobaculia bacterium]